MTAPAPLATNLKSQKHSAGIEKLQLQTANEVTPQVTNEVSIPYKDALKLFGIRITPFQLPENLPEDHHLCVFLRTQDYKITRLSSVPCAGLEGNAHLATKWNDDGEIEIHVITSNGSFGYTKKTSPSDSDRQTSYHPKLAQLGSSFHTYTIHHSDKEKEKFEFTLELAPEL